MTVTITTEVALAMRRNRYVIKGGRSQLGRAGRQAVVGVSDHRLSMVELGGKPP